MKTLLLCGYRKSELGEPTLGLERGEDGVTLLERRIRQLKSLRHDIIVVLAGNEADEILRQCPSIADTELAYDTNDTESTLTTNLKAGLAAGAGHSCYVLPVEIPVPEYPTWNFLREGFRRYALQAKVTIVQTLDSQGAPLHFGFPLLITRFGNSEIRATPELKTLADTRLKYLHLDSELKDA